ncbi:MAG: PIN domain-containing protein [Myxococcaceae bacterium]|nr:PIN domain-containing protein [Myxococcaceae bacterium]
MPDVNVLVYAHRTEYAQHEVARKFLEKCIQSGEAVGITPLVAGGFVRVVTSSKIHAVPTSLEMALLVIDSLVTEHRGLWVSGREQHWNLVKTLASAARSRGPDFTDAQHAAIAIENGATWASFDRGFDRFVPIGLRFNCLSS